MAIRVKEATQWFQQIEQMARRSRVIGQGASGKTEVSPADFERMVTDVERTGGPKAGAALRLAYEAAKRSDGPMPSFDEIASRLPGKKFEVFDANHDGFMDEKELSRLTREQSTYRDFYDLIPRAENVNTRVTTSATVGQIDRALELVDCVRARAAELLQSGAASTPEASLEQAARELGYPGAIPVLMAKDPQLASALLAADGTKIVDVDRPFDEPRREWNGVITNLELERNPATRNSDYLKQLLAFAAGLPVPPVPFEPPVR